ncbi:MAG TPA: ribonuclease, partial [Acidobacteriaceae bacterium]
MAKEICISTTPHETRLAIIEDDQLTEIYYERENEYTLAGSIYKGKVTRVLPGMQSAFVDLGLERDAFLYVTDFLEEQEDSEEFAEAPQNGGRKERSDGGRGRRGGAERNQDRPERPAAQQAAAPAGSAAAEAEGEPAEEGGKGEDFQQGTRRWRGRRGRRRGLRGVRGPEEGRTSTRDAEATGEREGEPEGGSSISIEAEAETPLAEPVRDDRGGRRERGRQQQAPATITLPGEALQKYGQQPAQAERQGNPSANQPEVRSSQVTVRPSTLVEHPIVWDGVSVALPGETLSRHRERPAGHTEPSATEQTEAEQETASEQQPLSSGHAAIDTAFPPAQAEEPAPLVLEEEEMEEEEVEEEVAPDAPTPEVHGEAEFDPENASASHRVDPSSPSEFRLSSLFGRESEPVDKQEQPGTPAQTAEAEHTEHIAAPAPEIEPVVADASSEEHFGDEHGASSEWAGTGADSETHAQVAEAPSGHSHEAAALDHLHAFTPGDGQVEEEVIDEDEYDFAPLPEHAHHDDEHDMSDLVEEETRVAGGAEIGDVIRDAQIDRQVISSDDDEFDDSDEEEDEDVEEEPSTAVVATEEGVPAPRRGRGDRQRGRERRGRGRNGR